MLAGIIYLRSACLFCIRESIVLKLFFLLFLPENVLYESNRKTRDHYIELWINIIITKIDFSECFIFLILFLFAVSSLRACGLSDWKRGPICMLKCIDHKEVFKVLVSLWATDDEWLTMFGNCFRLFLANVPMMDSILQPGKALE